SRTDPFQIYCVPSGENNLVIFSTAIILPMLRARPLAPLAAGVVTGIALAHLNGAWIPLAALGAVAALLSIRWRHPALLAVLGLGQGALRQQAAERPPRQRPRVPLE